MPYRDIFTGIFILIIRTQISAGLLYATLYFCHFGIVNNDGFELFFGCNMGVCCLVQVYDLARDEYERRERR